ncbi:MAG: methyltransferase domain-containing protein [Methylovulum sp.]|nr:methyltransferase domain-containing protein [Methylovulum sp.]
MQDSVSEDVAKMYDSPEGQLGPLMFGGHLHWGYWDASNPNDNFAAAADKLAQIMIDKTTIQAGQRFCDLGCGVGVPAMKLAKAKGCYVDGITISQFQQENASARALAEGLQERTTFFHASALAIPSADLNYDGGWFFESIFHMGHKAALLEAARVLKSGATLLLTDLPILPHTTEAFLAFVKEHIHAGFISKDDYPALLDEAGFELVELWDITENVMVPLVPKFKEAIDEHKQEILKCATEKEIDDWIYLFEYMSENLGYILVTARKR